MFNTPRPVLVIDDDAMLGELLAVILEEAGFQVVLSPNGEEGFCVAQAILPALIMCDQSMPGWSGTQVLAKVRAEAATANIPFVLMSGDTVCCPGATAFLPKPFSLDAVAALARTLVPTEEATLAA